MTRSKNKRPVDGGNNQEHDDPKLNPDIDEFLTVAQGAPGDFQDFFEKRLGDVFEIQLYKVTDTETIWLKTYNSVVPDRTTIGSTWGGGEYRAYGKTKGVRGTCMKRMKISSWWDGESLRLKAEQAKQLAGPAGPPPGSGTIDEVCKLVTAITPLFKAFSDRKEKPQSAATQFTELTDAFTKSQIGLVKKLGLMAAENINQDPAVAAGPVAEETTLMERLLQQGLQLLIDWGGGFMTTKGESRDKAVNTIKSDPRFSKLMGNQELINELYKKGCAHKKIGVKVMNEFFKACGCDLEEATPA